MRSDRITPKKKIRKVKRNLHTLEIKREKTKKKTISSV